MLQPQKHCAPTPEALPAAYQVGTSVLLNYLNSLLYSGVVGAQQQKLDPGTKRLHHLVAVYS